MTSEVKRSTAITKTNDAFGRTIPYRGKFESRRLARPLCRDPWPAILISRHSFMKKTRSLLLQIRQTIASRHGMQTMEPELIENRR